MTLFILYVAGSLIFWIVASVYLVAHDYPNEVPSIGDIMVSILFGWVLSLIWPLIAPLVIVSFFFRRFIVYRLAVAEREAKRPVIPMTRSEFDRIMANVQSEDQLNEIERKVRERGIE